MPLTINQDITIPTGRRWAEATVTGTATDVILAAVASFDESQPTPLSAVAVRIPSSARVRILVALANDATAPAVVNVNVWQRGGRDTSPPQPDVKCLVADDAATSAPPDEPTPVGKATAKKKAAGKKKKK